MRRDIFQFRRPVLEIVFGVVEDLARLVRAVVGGTHIAWHDWGVVKEVQDTAAVAREDDLLLGTLDRCCELRGVCFLQLLAGLK